MERAEQVTDRGAPAVTPTTPVRPERPLDLAGVSPDRTRLLLVDDGGATYTLPVTPGLRAALRGDAPRLGQLETPMESTLRPRDIQTRIRSGESAEAVAEAAGTSVDKIMPFVAPVLAERQHVAERAQRSTVRRPAGESGTGGRTLGDAVETHLRALNIDPDGVEWDSWRREDGRWTLAAGYALAVRTGSAHFTFDMPGNYVVLDDEDARWLVGDVVATPTPDRDDLQSVRERRLTSVAPEAVDAADAADDDQDELPLGEDAIDLVSEVEVEVVETVEVRVEEQMPLEAFFDDSPASDDPAQREEATDAAAAEVEPDPEPQPARRTVQKKKGRASVPSWDEIMFGPGGD